MGRKIPVLVPFLFSRVTRPCCREDSALSSMTTRPCSREDKKVPCRAFVCRVTQVVRRGASQLRHGSVRILKNHDDAGRWLSLFPLPFPRAEGSASKDSQLLLNKVCRTLTTPKKIQCCRTYMSAHRLSCVAIRVGTAVLPVLFILSS